MLLQRNGAYVRRVYSTLPLNTIVSLEDPQRLQNCVELEKELLFLYLQNLPHLDASLEDKVALNDVSRLIQVRTLCEWAGVEIPPYVKDCIDDLAGKVFASKKDAPNKMGFSELA